MPHTSTFPLPLQQPHEGGSRALGNTDEERAYYQLSRRVYSAFAYVYDAVTLPFRGLRRDVVGAAHLRPGVTVLDVATGTGAQALAFAGSVGKVIGIDLSDAMLGMARRKTPPPNVFFQQGDAAALPFPDAGFDAACVSFALHEMPGSVRERVLREMARVTRPGGTIIVVDYGLPKARATRFVVFRAVRLYEGEHYASFMRSDLDALLRKAGIEPEDHRTALAGLARIVIGRTSKGTAG
jgi:ubiquinone/menaquinone biosynthesis C-methylase UbiE